MPTSTTATSTGASAKAAYAIADDGLEERQRVVLLGVDEVGVRRDVVERATNSSSPSGSPSRQIRSVIRSTCGLVKRPVRRSRARSRVSIIRAVEVLPLVPVRWIDRVGALRVAEQLHERLDPVQRGLEPGLGPAGQQGVLDLGVGLGEAGGGGRQSSWRQSISSPGNHRPSGATGMPTRRLFTPGGPDPSRVDGGRCQHATGRRVGGSTRDGSAGGGRVRRRTTGFRGPVPAA